MPSSGYGITELVPLPDTEDAAECAEYAAKYRRLTERAQHAMSLGMFGEWMASFLSAWEQTKDVDVASWAGLEEWDM